MTSILPWGDRAHHQQGEYPSQFRWPNPENLLPLSRVVVRTLGIHISAVVTWPDCSHETDAPFHAIPIISRILNISLELAVSMDEGIDDTHHYNSMSEAS